MPFIFTPEEALPCAEALFSLLTHRGLAPAMELAAFPDAPYRTTLHVSVNGELVLYEVQGALDLHDRLIHFGQWLAAGRKNAQLILVAEQHAQTTVEFTRQAKLRGVGLLVRLDGLEFDEVFPARNHAYVVTPDPGLRLGDRRAAVLACVAKFNDGARKDGLRDMCEVVEHETRRVLEVAQRRGLVNLTLKAVAAMHWADRINALGSKNIMNGGRDALIDTKLRDDLNSFRGARNLVDHPAGSAAVERRRRQQFTERMMMGARLVAELATVRRRLR